MKTREVLLASENELSVKLRLMKIKELDHHIEKLLASFGIDDYKVVIRSVIKVMPEIKGEGGYQTVQNLIAQKIPDSRRQNISANDELARIAIMIVVRITKQFEKIHRERP